jgi:selenide,water dikinase
MPGIPGDLWSLSASGGCAAKLGPRRLEEITSTLKPRRAKDLLVGMESSDDAAVYRLGDGSALVLTVDFITPVCGDPYRYGQVAAANALSDVYAMGGTPLAALNVCCFPNVDAATLSRVLDGGLSKIEEAGAVLAGGHTVRDDELKYGLSVTGLVSPKTMTPNSGARAGDALVLTKPIGTGLYVSAAKQGLLAPEAFGTALESMATLNKTACETMIEFEVRGCTDVTGFGLGGHAFGMARASRLAMRIDPKRVPVHPETRRLLEQGVTTGATAANARHLEGRIRGGAPSGSERSLFFDPQTSGGLLLAVRRKDADGLVKALRGRGVTAASIAGDCVASDDPYVEIIKD